MSPDCLAAAKNLERYVSRSPLCGRGLSKRTFVPFNFKQKGIQGTIMNVTTIISIKVKNNKAFMICVLKDGTRIEVCLGEYKVL